MSATVIPSIFTAVDKFSAPVQSMTGQVDKFAAKSEGLERKFRKISSGAKTMAVNAGAVGLAILAPLGLATNAAVGFEEKMADVSKTTGIQGKGLEKLGNEILDLSTKTRTSISSLQDIAVIGGQLGIAESKMLDFTKTANKFNVALGSDYSGGLESAVLSVGKLNSLFSDTVSLEIDEHLNRAGSSFNQLSASGKSSVENINDFASRVGTLPDVLKPSFAATAGLGAFLEEVGINSERGASGFSTLLLTAGKNLPNFAKQMGISTLAARELLETSPVDFAQKFSRSLAGLSADKLSGTLGKLKIGGQESIKVVGALSDQSSRLSEMIGISNNAFNEATSLTDEYNVKNNTTAAMLDKARNNFEAVAITVGTQLIPIINSLLKKVSPIIQSFVRWTKENQGTFKTIVIMTASLGALALVVAGISTVVKAFTAAQWLLNVALNANPISLIVIGVAALTALVVTAIAYWDDWGAAVLAFSGPIGIVISLIQSFRRNWDMISNAFSTGGVMAGIRAIGVTIVDSILMPLHQVLQLVSKIPGLGDLAGSAANSIQGFRRDLGVNLDGSEGATDPIINNDVARQENLQRSIQEQKQNVSIDINDKSGRASVDQGNGMIPINLTSTFGY